MAVYTALTEAQTRNLSAVNTDHTDNDTSVDYNDNYSSDNITVIGDNNHDDVIENITSLGSMTSSDKSAVRPDLLVPVYQPMTYHITAMEAKEPEKPAEISADLSVAYEEIPPPSRTPSPITPTCAASPLRSRNQQLLASNLPDLVLDVNQSTLTTGTAPCLPDVVPQQKTPRKHSTSSPQRRGSFRIVSKELANHQTTPKNSPHNDSIDEGYHSQAKRLRSNENSPATEPRQSPQTKDNTVVRPTRGAQRKLQFQTSQQEPGNLQVLDTWKNIGYQLNRISTNFAARNRLQNTNTDHVDFTGHMSLITRGYTMITNNSNPTTTNEDEVDTMSHAPRGAGRKYLAELAVSVVTNAIVFICVRKLQKIIF